MRKTPWTKPSSSLPSDRIKPKPSPTSTPGKGKGKGQHQQGEAAADPPKSKAVRRLEHLLNGLRTASLKERDPQGGCFCLARSHELSPYTPLCRSCGLILCTLNAPYHACPHCTQPLLSSSSSPSPSSSSTRESLITRLESELESTLADEHKQRERALEQARQAAGAFPQLHAPSLSSSPYGSHSNSPSPSPSPLHSLSPAGAAARMSAASAPPSSQTHKVMSLTGTPKGGKAGNTRRVVVSSYTTTTTPVASRPSSRSNNNNNVDDLEDGMGPRVPPPAPEPTFVSDKTEKEGNERPWQNLIHGPATYKPPTRLDDVQGQGSSGGAATAGTSRRRRGNKGKGKENAE